MTPQYRQSFTVALTGHVLLIIAALVVSVVPGCLKPRQIDLPVDFIPLRTDLPLQRSTPTPKNPTPTPPAPETPQAPREPDMPKDPLPPPPPDKPEPPVKTPEKVPEKDPLAPSPDHVKLPIKPKPAHTNLAEVAHADHVPVKIGPKIKQTVLVPGALVAHVHQPPRLSAADLAKALGAGGSSGGFAAPQGEYDSVPLDEKQRCLILIRCALYNAWDQPAAADAGSRPAELEIHFDLSGRVTGYTIAQPSGSELYDRTVLLAAKAVPRVEGLSPSFLRAYARLTIKFELQ